MLFPWIEAARKVCRGGKGKPREEGMSLREPWPFHTDADVLKLSCYLDVKCLGEPLKSAYRSMEDPLACDVPEYPHQRIMSLGSPFSPPGPHPLPLLPGSIYVASSLLPRASSVTCSSTSYLRFLSRLCLLGFFGICIASFGHRFERTHLLSVSCDFCSGAYFMA